MTLASRRRRAACLSAGSSWPAPTNRTRIRGARRRARAPATRLWRRSASRRRSAPARRAAPPTWPRAPRTAPRSSAGLAGRNALAGSPCSTCRVRVKRCWRCSGRRRSRSCARAPSRSSAPRPAPRSPRASRGSSRATHSRERGGGAVVAGAAVAIGIRRQAEGAVVVQVLHGGHAVTAAGVVDGAGDERHEVVQVHDVDALGAGGGPSRGVTATSTAKRRAAPRAGPATRRQRCGCRAEGRARRGLGLQGAHSPSTKASMPLPGARSC